MSKYHYFHFNIFIGISYCWVALLALRFCISLKNISLVLILKQNAKFKFHILFLMFSVLGYLENFSIDWRTGSVWDVSETKYVFLEIFRVLTISLKILRKVLATFLPLEMIFSFSVNVILALDLILFETRGKRFPKLITGSNVFYIKAFKLRSFWFPKKTNARKCFVDNCKQL